MWLRGVLTRNIGLKALALGISVLLWGMVREEQDVEEVVNVSISIDTPEDLIYLNTVSQYINVRLRGPRSRLRNAQEADLQMVIDLGGAVPGENLINVAQYRIRNLPDGVSVAAYYPAVLTLDIDRLVEKELPIEVRFTGNMPPDYRLVSTEVTPSTILLEGAERQLDPMPVIYTEPVNMRDFDADQVYSLTLDYGDTSLSPKGRPEPIQMDVDVEIEMQERIFEEVVVRLVTGQERYRIEPPHTVVRVKGPLSQVEALTPAFVRVFVDPNAVPEGSSFPVTVTYSEEGPTNAETEASPSPKVTARLTRPGSPDVKIMALTPKAFSLVDTQTPPPEAASPDPTAEKSGGAEKKKGGSNE